MVDHPPVIANGFIERLLEWIRAKVEDSRDAQKDKRFAPDLETVCPLLSEYDLIIVVAQIQQISGVGEVEKLSARRLFSLTFEVRQEVVSI